MKMPTATKLAIPLAAALALTVTSANADTFGSGVNAFTIDFVNIGNAGNGDDLGAGGGNYSSPYGGVGYDYRMGVTEVPQDWITKATNLGMTNVTAGTWAGNQPAANMTWFEAAAFVNFLNTSTVHQAAYQLTGVTSLTPWGAADAWDNDPGAGVDLNLYRHKDAYYFLPSEDEWYKSAYHQNDGVTANFWDYATGSNTIPEGVDFAGDTVFEAVFFQGIIIPQPNGVTNVGIASPYGTIGQNGNVKEWNESASDGVNNSSSEGRAIRGGYWNDAESSLRSSGRGDGGPRFSFTAVGFRIASVPEPTASMLTIGSGMMWLTRRRRESAL